MAEDFSRRLYVPNFDQWRSALSQNRFSDRSLGVNVVEHGIVLPARKSKDAFEGGVCDHDFKFVAGFSRIDGGPRDNGFACVNASYTVERSKIVELDEDVIYGGSLIGHFGHFMAECWCRLWYVIQHPDNQSKILFITTTHGGWHPWMDDFFELMGIDRRRLVYIKQPTQCRSIIVPDQSEYSARSFTKEFLIPYDAIKARVQPSAPKKLYLTRKEYEADDNIGVHCFNERYFEDFFVARGFEAVSLEKLPIAEQIALIMGADELAATVGTLTHWSMFCKPGAKFIMLNRTDYSSLALQCLINQAFKVDYYIVDASKNFMYANWNVGVCMLGSNRHWKNFVANYFGERIDVDDDAPSFDGELGRYVDFWCRKYPQSKHAQRWIDSLKAMCDRIVALEKQIYAKRPLIRYQTHVGQDGWKAWRRENFVSGAVDRELDVQAIRINFSEPFHDVYYSVWYNEKEGWSKEVSNGAMAGTTGRSKSIFGLSVRLDDEGSARYDILYRLHDFSGKWSPWAKNGERLRSSTSKINAIQIKLEERA